MTLIQQHIQKADILSSLKGNGVQGGLLRAQNGTFCAIGQLEK